MPPLQTIGYEATTIADVVRTLGDAGTELLIDVRAIASSRKPGFSKRQLAAALDQVGIAYVHLRDLGTPKAGRDAIRAGHPERMVPIFSEHMRSDRAQAELAQARMLASERRTCLLCYERDHTTCHRRLVAELMTEQTGQPVDHLVPPAV